jgi:transposase-like protein
MFPYVGASRDADACAEPGEIGALLRREGLYSSHLTAWRRQREQGALAGLAPKKRGRRGAPPHPLARRVSELEREKTRLQHRLQQAEAIIDGPQRVSELLGIPLNPPGSDERA